jgi:iron-sulfur cluster repair protein YtfE (RIC family)
MNSITPIKRNIALQTLSREHYHGLMLCLKIRKGIARHVEESRMKRYADWFYATHLIPHFQAEEQLIFPVLGNGHKLVEKALFEHRRINRLFVKEKNLLKSVSLIEEELERHIRFEERILFNELERTATAEQLVMVDRLHQEHHFEENTEDEFWKKLPGE